MERFECRIPITSAQRRHVEHVAHARATAPDATASFEFAAIEIIGCKPDKSGNLLAAHLPSSGKSAISVASQHDADPWHGGEQPERWGESRIGCNDLDKRSSSRAMSAVSPATRRRERRCSIAPSSTFIKDRSEALYVVGDPLLTTNRIRINYLGAGRATADKLRKSGVRRSGRSDVLWPQLP